MKKEKLKKKKISWKTKKSESERKIMKKEKLK